MWIPDKLLNSTLKYHNFKFKCNLTTMIYRFMLVFFENELLFNIRSTSNQLENLKTTLGKNLFKVYSTSVCLLNIRHDFMMHYLYRKETGHNFSETETPQQIYLGGRPLTSMPTLWFRESKTVPTAWLLSVLVKEWKQVIQL